METLLLVVIVAYLLSMDVRLTEAIERFVAEDTRRARRPDDGLVLRSTGTPTTPARWYLCDRDTGARVRGPFRTRVEALES